MFAAGVVVAGGAAVAPAAAGGAAVIEASIFANKVVASGDVIIFIWSPGVGDILLIELNL